MENLLIFPCRFPLKVIGERHDEFVKVVSDVVRIYALDLVAEDVVLRSSTGSRFYALTINVNATSKDQLDAIYRALSHHPMVKMVL